MAQDRGGSTKRDQWQWFWFIQTRSKYVTVNYDELFYDIQVIPIISSLACPNIVQFFGVYISESKKYLVMEYMSSGSVLSLVQQKKDTIKYISLLDM